MKICAISDMHGRLDFDIKPCDILCICGDILPTTIQSLHEWSIKWLIEEFIPWCEKQPCEKVFFIAGNHDFVFMHHPDDIDEILEGNKKITYLLDEETEYKKGAESIRIYGTPWCHQFYNWAFMAPDENLKDIYSKIPYKVDVLLTHDCPYGTSDVILQEDVPWYDGKTHIGCHPLGDAVDEKKPRFHFCGHLHSCTHIPQQRGETMVTNVSVVNEHYKRVYEPLYMEI